MRRVIGQKNIFFSGLFAIVALVCVVFPSPAEARRTALIIANSAYVNAKELPNPVNDAELVADSAAKAGFEVVIATDLTKAAFDQTLREFREKADGSDVALIYYAGHGIESGGTNWMIPVDAKLAEIRDLRFEAIDLDALLETLGDAQRRIVILDACRDNPFGSNWSMGVRSAQKGLAQNPIEGALIIYAASQGQVAVDGTGANSPFAQAVARRIAEPGLLLQLLGPKVTDDVLAATKGRQRPWTYSGMGGEEFYLVPGQQLAGASPKPPADARPGDAAAGADSYKADSYAWRYADTQNTVQDYEDYLSKFPAGVFAQNAKLRLEKLRAAGRPALMSRTMQTDPAAPDGGKGARGKGRAKPAKPDAGSFGQAFKSDPADAGSAALVRPDPGNPRVAPAAATSAGAAMITANRMVDLAPLPALPAAPAFPATGYPDCRESYRAVQDPNGRVAAINRCLGLLDDYSVKVLNVFRAGMADHQREISALYTDRVAGQDKYSGVSQRQFFQDMMKEFGDSDPNGAQFAGYREAEARYKADRAYLDDRYCFSTGRCGGYAVPQGISPAGK